MKVFWSWQSDTLGKIGRHFVRAALVEAIEVLKAPKEIEEPLEREAREALEIDHDRRGVSGSPDLARTIFDKIEAAAVFVADVTIVGSSLAMNPETKRPRKLINSNVAIEYGFAEHAIGDRKILLVQNVHFGDRNDLPFDLKHKAGPIQFNLAPDASASEISLEKSRLRGTLVEALKPYLNFPRNAGLKANFEETPTVDGSAAYFANSRYPLAVVGDRDQHQITYCLNEARVFYLRLIPTKIREPQLKFAELFEVVSKRRIQTLSYREYAGIPDRNSFGAITYEPPYHPPNNKPVSLTQLFKNGEMWSIGTSFHTEYEGGIIIFAKTLENATTRVTDNFCNIAQKELGVEPPYSIEIGGVGLNGVRLVVAENTFSEPIHQSELKVRRVIKEATTQAIGGVVAEFMDRLHELSGTDRPQSRP
jgi:hypothetical protein